MVITIISKVILIKRNHFNLDAILFGRRGNANLTFGNIKALMIEGFVINSSISSEKNQNCPFTLGKENDADFDS